MNLFSYSPDQIHLKPNKPHELLLRNPWDFKDSIMEVGISESAIVELISCLRLKTFGDFWVEKGPKFGNFRLNLVKFQFKMVICWLGHSSPIKLSTVKREIISSIVARGFTPRPLRRDFSAPRLPAGSIPPPPEISGSATDDVTQIPGL